MKRTNVVLDVLIVVLVVFIALAASAAPGEGQGRYATGARMINTNGFNSYGQYVAARGISDDLNIPVDALKTEMIDNHLSLSDAIKKLRPELSRDNIRVHVKKAEAAAKKAEEEARRLEPIDDIQPRLSN